MFDWFYEFLYLISKSMYRIIDGMMECANKLCGITPITVRGQDIDMITYLLTSDQVSNAFKVSAILGLILVVCFAIAGIIRSIVSEKGGATPGQICVKVFKTILVFLFIPVCMLTFSHFINTFMLALYKGSLGGSQASLGSYLAGAFAQDALKPNVDPNFYLNSTFNYRITDEMWKYCDLTEYDFFFSWITGISVILALAKALLAFVDRAISIALLFVVSPLSISTTIIDDGGRFKLWRDQVIIKFLVGYATIVGMNIYILVMSLIVDPAVIISDNTFLNTVFKIAFFIGGAVSLDRVGQLGGNLVSAGAGTSEGMANDRAAAGFKRAVGKLGSAALAPAKAARGIANFGRDWSQLGFKGAAGKQVGNAARALGLRTNKDYGYKGPTSKTEKQQQAEENANKESERKKNNSELATSIGEKVAKAIQGGGGEQKKDNQANQNMKTAIQNSGMSFRVPKSGGASGGKE